MAETPSEKQQALLKEYELAQNKTLELEKTIWQAFGVMGVGSAVAPFVVGSLIKYNVAPIIIFIIGGLVWYASRVWCGIARRWWSIQHVTYIRMRHIEEDLGLYQNRYITYVDAYKKDPIKAKTSEPENLAEGRLKELKDRADENDAILGLRAHARKGPQEWLKWLPHINLMLWIGYGVYLVVQLLKMLGNHAKGVEVHETLVTAASVLILRLAGLAVGLASMYLGYRSLSEPPVENVSLPGASSSRVNKCRCILAVLAVSIGAFIIIASLFFEISWIDGLNLPPWP